MQPNILARRRRIIRFGDKITEKSFGWWMPKVHFLDSVGKNLPAQAKLNIINLKEGEATVINLNIYKEGSQTDEKWTIMFPIAEPTMFRGEVYI